MYNMRSTMRSTRQTGGKIIGALNKGVEADVMVQEIQEFKELQVPHLHVAIYKRTWLQLIL